MNNTKDHVSLWQNVNIMTMTGEILKNATLICRNGMINWVGLTSDLPQGATQNCEFVYDCQGKWMTPGLIDCHTHIVHGGQRANEFRQKLHGASYAEIAKQGGGIISTVKKTRNLSSQQLFDESLPRIQQLMSEGVTTIEIKSGYGLDIDNEIKMLNVANDVERLLPLTVQKTFLAAHALPPEFNNNDDYIDFIINKMLPAALAQNCVDAVDGFCESIAFNQAQIEKLFMAARKNNLPVKLHAEQLSDQQGAMMAANYQALSVDHLEYISEPGVKAISESGTVAVLLPAAFYFLHEKKLPPIDLFRQYHVPIACATDCNPGSSPCSSLLLVMNMACVLFKLTPEEVLQSVTINAAKALGMANEIGSIEINKQCDFVLWDITEPAELCYRIAFNPCFAVVKQGNLILNKGIKT